MVYDDVFYAELLRPSSVAIVARWTAGGEVRGAARAARPWCPQGALTLPARRMAAARAGHRLWDARTHRSASARAGSVSAQSARRTS